MRLATFLPLAFCSSALSQTQVRGVPNSKLPLYQGENGLFSCLDGSKTIPIQRVNDDYCDCIDGSDEPGTSACSNGIFFCQNAGHIPTYIRSSRVNDGVCEEECCDGSDEWLGLTKCPNTCRQKAKEHAQKTAQQEATRLSGWKVKEEWFKKAHILRLEVEDELQRSDARLQALRTNLADKESALTKLQHENHNIAQADNEAENAIELTVLKFKTALNMLRDQAAAQEARIAEYEALLKDLSQGYNPNYQDMAVKGAVTTYNQLAPLSEPVITEEALQELLDTTVAFPKASAPPVVSGGVVKYWQGLRSKLVELGILQRDSSDLADKSEPQQVVNLKASTEKLREEVSQVEKSCADAQDNLSRDFGEHDVLRAVKGLCFSSLISDYTYEVCLLENLHQKSSSLNTLVGTFDHIDENGSLVYSHGQRCWNGPERSGRVDLECGSTNELISVREAQKCEYVFRVKSPLACTSSSSQVTNKKDEL